MNWTDLLTALALVLILEGLFPFINPAALKKFYLQMMQTPESSLRIFGLISIVSGLVLLYLI